MNVKYNIRVFIFCSIAVLCACGPSQEQSQAESMLSGKTVGLAGTSGWVADGRFKMSQPSNVITNNGYTYVFYVKEPFDAPLSGTGLGGTIHYAFSRDQGNTWSDQGLVISKGLPGQFDAQGIAKPAVIQATDDRFFYLYYVGIGDGYNISADAPQNRSGIGMAKLIFNEDGAIRVAIKLNSGKPVLEPSEAGAGRFDSYSVDDPNPINMNGQVWLYYTGLDKWKGTPRMGLAVSADINASHIKQNNTRALLDGSPSLLQKQDKGVLAIFTDTQNAWFASDGLHFNKLHQRFPSPVKNARGNGDTPALSWGLADPASADAGFSKWTIK